MRVAPKVLVSTMSAPGRQVLLVDLLDDVGPGELQQLVVALQVLGVVLEALAAVVGLGQLVALDHRAHGAVDDQDALLQQRGQGGAAGEVGIRETITALSLKPMRTVRAKIGCIDKRLPLVDTAMSPAPNTSALRQSRTPGRW